MKKKILTATIIIAILLIGVSIFYYFVIFLPQNHREVIELQNQKEQKLNDCLAETQKQFELAWDSTCSNGIGDWINKCQGVQEEDCNECILPDEESKRLNSILKDSRDECFKKYSIN